MGLPKKHCEHWPLALSHEQGQPKPLGHDAVDAEHDHPTGREIADLRP